MLPRLQIRVTGERNVFGNPVNSMGNRHAQEKATPSVDDHGHFKAGHEHPGQAVFPYKMAV